MALPHHLQGHEGRMYEAHQHVAMARLFDDEELPTRMIGVDEIQELHPLVSTENIACGIWSFS